MLALVVLAGCAEPEPSSTTPPEPAVPAIDEVLDCGETSSIGGIADGEGLLRRDIDLQRFPDAVCNDGTGGVFYVREAEDPAHADDWVIYFQGGGLCRDGETCADRWCHRDQNFGMNKMSSAPAPAEGIVGNGVLSRDPRNPLAGYNAVFLYYCSSDLWSGTRSNVVLEDDDGNAYTVHFRGNAILDAVIETLRPDLDDAQRIIVAGSSAGGTAVITNLDRLAEELGDADTEVVGLIDAIYAPLYEDLDYANSVLCEPDNPFGGPFCSWEELQRDDWENVDQGLHGSEGDVSCRTSHPEDTWVCADDTHTVANHLTTPFFIRMDQRDELIGANYVASGFMDEVAFADAVAAQVAALADHAATAEEGAAITQVPGGFAPRCGHHEALANTDATFEVAIQVDGVNYRTLDLFVQWMEGGSPTIAVAGEDNASCSTR